MTIAVDMGRKATNKQNNKDIETKVMAFLRFKNSSQSPYKKVWDMIRKISGKTKSPSYTHLNHPVAETKSTSKFDIAETLGETFLNNSCSRNYSEKFQKVKAEQEKI